MNGKIVVVLGASDKAERFSNKAVKKLKDFGHQVVPIHPRLKDIEGLPVAHDLTVIRDDVDTLTLYVGPQRSKALIEQIIALRPKRVIFNPGTESLELEQQLMLHNIAFVKACTLVMLDAGEF
jgi:predicted CoA-binding protein